MSGEQSEYGFHDMKHTKDLKMLVETHWGIHPTGVDRLMGYEIATYCIETETERYILKQYPKQVDLETRILFENKVLGHLAHIDAVVCPRVLKTLNDAELLRDQRHIFRLQSFLNGTFLAEATLNQSLMASIGETLGKMDKALQEIPGPYPVFDTAWDLRHTAESERLLDYIQGPENRRLAAYFLHQFKAEVLPQQYDLPVQLIYGDANEWNILTDQQGVSGIIDFGDLCRSWRINELAIGLVYTLMFSENPVHDAGPMITGYHGICPLTETEVDLLYYLIAARLCISVCWAAMKKSEQPDNAYYTISEERAWKLLHRWIRINPIHARENFREAIGMEKRTDKGMASIRARRDQFISKSLSVSYDTPITMTRSALQYMYDADGRTYLDAYNNIMLVGHCHPRVAEAARNSYSRLNTNTRYLYEELPAYAEKLLSRFPPELCRVFFVNSGSAAADLALRLAHHHTGKSKCVALEEGYHGNTLATVEVSPYKTKKGKKPESTIAVELPNAFALPSEYREDAGTYYSNRAVSRISKYKGEIAAFIAEPIVGCGGQIPLPKGYLERIYPEIHAQGGVCISDEVQVGFGRLGSVFWGYELQQVVPDIVILGKPMGNGHPIGAVVTTLEIANSFESGPEFFSSFGGNPVSCAIGAAVLDVIRDEALQEHAQKVGAYFKKQLIHLQNECAAIADVRGEGLFLGLELADSSGKPDGKIASFITNFLKDNGILTSTDGPFNQVIKIKPPLCFSMENADECLQVLRRCLKNSGSL